jgi:hypothetical protein
MKSLDTRGGCPLELPREARPAPLRFASLVKYGSLRFASLRCYASLVGVRLRCVRACGRLAWISPAVALFAVAPSARAQSREDAAAYCEYVTAIADSTSALDMAPVLFGTAGLVSGQDVSPGGSLLGPTRRVIAGASYSVSGLYRGIETRAGADAECRRYRAVSELHAFLESNREGATRGSLDAKLRVLDEAMPKADEMLAAARAALMQSRTTIEQVGALEVRVDALRAMAAQTRAERDAMAVAPRPPDRPIRDVLHERDEAEAEAERRQSHIRESRAWDVSVRGGYDQIFGGSVSYTPVFALVTVTASVGALWQPAADDRAVAGRVGWARRQIEGVDDRVAQAIARLQALREGDRKRIEETRVLLVDLQARWKVLQGMAGDRVAELAQYVWFDLVRTEAEHAFLTAHVADLDRMLGKERPER